MIPREGNLDASQQSPTLQENYHFPLDLNDLLGRRCFSVSICLGCIATKCLQIRNLEKFSVRLRQILGKGKEGGRGTGRDN